jgi:hypothetical protein
LNGCFQESWKFYEIEEHDLSLKMRRAKHTCLTTFPTKSHSRGLSITTRCGSLFATNRGQVKSTVKSRVSAEVASYYFESGFLLVTSCDWPCSSRMSGTGRPRRGGNCNPQNLVGYVLEESIRLRRCGVQQASLFQICSRINSNLDEPELPMEACCESSSNAVGSTLHHKAHQELLARTKDASARDRGRRAGPVGGKRNTYR